MRTYFKLLIWKFVYRIDRIKYFIGIKLNKDYIHKRTIKLLNILNDVTEQK